ncbi:MAG: hypothetical protein IT373_24705 [Polyangiaceae bacterium]|nr:hypothetical protein [Polyangiaceae bacterium]
MALAACSNDVETTPVTTTTTTTTGTGGTGGAGGGGGNASGKVDLLVVIDNSRGMADKHSVLAATLPELVGALVNPRCLDASGLPVAGQPATAADPCPAQSTRELRPVTDLHIGVISSSIGGHGADTCSAVSQPTENDAAHLLDRADPSGSPTVPTYESLGFLAWDPAGALTPPGETDAAALVANLGAMVLGVGQVGCGFEAQLESWYRFLVDPDPYASIAVVNGTAELQGTDQALLDQRAAFLRPDSVVAIVMLSDENDCSTRDGGQYFYANQAQTPGSPSMFLLPRPRQECATDPTDPCCLSCGEDPGNCPADPTCGTLLYPIEDNINLRCFEQKRRFGIDFLWPIDRYTTGLTAAVVPDRAGNLVPNPLFAGGRSAGDVYLAGIVGVPWQDIARQTAGSQPDLLAGLDADGHAVGGYQSAAELSANGVWALVVGTPATWVPAGDPLMRESILPRNGTNPVTGDPLMPPGSGLLANPINGHEYTITQQNDLQYACIYPLPTPRDCSSPSTICDCNDPNNNSPLCQAPNGQYGQTQYYAKGYPGRRELTLLSTLGNQAVVGSVCTAQLGNATAPDYAYRPTVAALAEALRGSLAP